MSLSQTCVSKLYSSVIDDVIGGVREFFIDEGVDEQVLLELKQIWETRLKQTKAVEPPPDPIPPPLKTGNSSASKQVVNHGAGTVVSTAAPTLNLPTEPKTVSIQITLPAQHGSLESQARHITIQVPSTALSGNQLQSVLTGPVISATMALPVHLATTLLQQHVTAALQGQSTGLIQAAAAASATSNGVNNSTGDAAARANMQAQGSMNQLDGQFDTSDEDDDNDDEDDVDDDDDDDADLRDEEDNEDDAVVEEEPLNSGDDVSEEDPKEMFETDNVVVCQYDKITRSRNKWKFYLKDGIMNLGGKDYVFQKSNGDAEW